MGKKKNNKEVITQEQAIEKLASILEEGEEIDIEEVEKEKEVIQEKEKEQEKEEVKKEEVDQEKKEEDKKDQEKKEDGEEKKKNSPIAKVKTLKKKEKRTERDNIYDMLKIVLEEKFGEVRMSKEGWAFQVEEGGEMKWHCVRVIAKKGQPEFK